MKNVRKVISLVLVLLIALMTVPTFACEENDNMPVDVGKYLADMGLKFSYVGEMEHPDGHFMCQVWKREYGPSGMLWIPTENCTVYGICYVIVNSDSFFFPWEAKEPNESWLSTDFLKSTYDIDIQITGGPQSFLVSYEGRNYPYIISDEDAITSDPQGGIIRDEKGNFLIRDRLVTTIVTDGRF